MFNMEFHLAVLLHATFLLFVTGRTTVFAKEAAEGEEAPEPTEEESEQGPEPLSTLDKDVEVEGGEAWTPVFSSTNSGVKNQVLCLGTCAST